MRAKYAGKCPLCHGGGISPGEWITRDPETDRWVHMHCLAVVDAESAIVDAELAELLGG